MPILRRKQDGPTKLSEEFIKKVNQARDNLKSTAPKRDEAWAFYRGDHFAYINDQGQIAFRPDGSIGVAKRGKPSYRARQVRNYIFDVVLREESNASQRVPGYQVVSSTTDPQDVSAARLSEKVLAYGYERWNLRKATVEAVTHAIVGGEAFAWVYFDNTIGTYLGDGIATGDVRVKVYGGNEVYWTPGCRFYDAPCHYIDHAMAPEQVEAMPGYLLEKGKLATDANVRSLAGRKKNKGDLVLVTHALERPTPQNEKGKWITLANDKRIIEDRDYPGDGEMPCLRQLIYAPDPEADRDLALVPQLIDAQRTKNDAENKAVEWKNHALFPQWVVAPGLLKKQRRTDEPGKTYEIPNPKENLVTLDPPVIPDGLFTMADRAEEDLFRIAGQSDPPPGTESGKAFQVWIEKNTARAGMFFASLAQWHSQVAHDCLVQVAENYNEPRLLQVKGDFGWESIEDFKGAQLRDQVDVRVFADSIEPQTRQAKEQKIMTYIQVGAIDPVSGMTAIETGATEGLIRSYAHDEARVGRVIQRLKQGPETLGQMPSLPTGRLQKVPMTDPTTGAPMTDPMTGQPTMVDSDQPEMAPGWMPRYSDNLGIWRTTFEDFMKGEDYERLIPEVQQAAATIYAGILMLEAEKAAEAQAAQMAQAEDLGMTNAAKPQMKPSPSLPSLNGSDAS